MNIDLKDRTALVTGGSRGLGRAIAERLSRSGADVAIVARRPDVLENTVSELRRLTVTNVAGYPCDVADMGQVELTCQSIEKDFGGIDILINNAGSSARRPFEQIDPDFFKSDFDLKVQAAVRFSQLILPGMRQRKWGRIINIVSIYGKAPPAASAPTSVNRAAGIALTKVMANEFGKDNILVNAICTGFIRSDQWPQNHRSEAPQMDYEEYLKMRTKDVPLGRLGEAEEFANVICFLSSEAASYVTGTAINVDGGRSPIV